MDTTEDKLREYLKVAVGEAQDAQRRVRELEGRDREPVAVVGVGCRYPGGVGSAEDLWGLVVEERDGVGGFPSDRGWDLAGLFDGDPSRVGSSYVREGGFLYGAADFDAGFFGISPREALAMDPQQRLLLEVSWEAIERAGIDPRSLRGSDTNVYQGVMYHDYATRFNHARSGLEGYLAVGNFASVASGRVSYQLGLGGAAVTVDTACSSSLVALDLAVRALRRGECGMALAGGITVMSTPAAFVEFSRQKALAGDGRCKSFASAADGTAWAEGVGVLVLERLSDARRLGHPVWALVRGSAVNQDGASNGLTAPNGPSQRRVIAAALVDAGLSAGQVDAVEGHGTGTPLGDPIEAQALLATYGQSRVGGRPLWLGSLKSNIGHTQAAAGVGGVIKMVMAMRHGVLPATLHVDEPSDQVDWGSGAVRLLESARPWPETGQPRRAGVSSFGISGTNAHVVLEEAPAELAPPLSGRLDSPGMAAKNDLTTAESADPTGTSEPDDLAGTESDRDTDTDRATATATATATDTAGDCDGAESVGLPGLVGGVVVWVVSGRSERALRAQAGRVAGFVGGVPGVDVVDVGYSLAVSRSVFECRAAVVGADREQLVAGLAAVAAGRVSPAAVTGPVVGGGVGFMFTGQGSQRPGMGAGLYGCSPVFAEAVDRACGLLEGNLPGSLREVIFAAEGSAGALLLEQTGWAQLALFAIEYGLAELLRSWGVVPAAVMGHSVGELVAAQVAGVFSLSDACRLVVARASLMQALPAGGAMAAVEAEPGEVERYLAGAGLPVAVAAVNGPRSVVISGERAVVEVARSWWQQQQRRTSVLRVSHGFHSVLMEPMLEEFAAAAAGITYHAPHTPIISTLTGELADPDYITTAGYWTRQLRDTVQFHHALTTITATTATGTGVGALIELGPDPVLTALATDTLTTTDTAGSGPVPPLLIPTLRHDTPDDTALARTLAHTYLTDTTPDWETIHSHHNPPPTRIDLPTYPFQHQRHWYNDTHHTGDQFDAGAQVAEPAPALYDVEWIEQELPEPAVAAGVALVGASDRVREALTGAGIDAADYANPQAYLGALAAGETTHATVLLELGALERVDSATAAHQQAALALNLMQGCAGGDGSAESTLVILTDGAVAAGDEAMPDPALAAVWGLVRTAQQEQPDRYRLIDLDRSEVSLRCLPQVLAARTLEAAVRHGACLVPRLRTLTAPETEPATEPVPGWDPAGTVLIVGGTGRVGSRIACKLARDYGVRHIMILSRHGESARGVPELVEELAAFGTKASFVAGDAAEADVVRAALSQISPEHPLRAVVHAAGTLDDGIVSSLDSDRLDKVLRAKVDVAQNLDEATKGLPLDAFIMLSSAAGSMGRRGQASYTAANAFLDALAFRRRAQGAPAISVGFGLWMYPSADIGSNITEGMRVRLAREGMLELVDDEALSLFDEALRSASPAVLPMRLSAGAVSESAPNLLRRTLGAGTEPSAEPVEVSPSDELAALAPAERQQHALLLVQGQVAAILGHDSPQSILPDQAFFDIGFDSLTAVELRNSLSSVLGRRLPSTVVFDYPTSRAIAEYLVSELAEGSTAGPASPVIHPALDHQEPIAIVSMSCRLPGDINSPDELWELVAAGGDAVGGFPSNRGWDLNRLYDPDPDKFGTTYTREGGFLYNAGRFDADLFGISPREAVAMDPQHRILLELSWEAFEAAGIDPRSVRGSSTGVFAGLVYHDYATFSDVLPDELQGYIAIGNGGSVATGRISYVLGLEGPAITVDTACSSSLVAIHLAVQSLRHGECALALAGGATIMSSPGGFLEFTRNRALSPDGRCKAYTDEADGTGFSEGGGLLMLERLSDARANGHPVLATIRGSAVNQDGASNGLTAPNGRAQQRVIRQALANAQLSPADIDAVEGHGTGTPLGDPIEVGALQATYGRDRPTGRPLYLGSLKSNIGHTQAAAGVASVIKMVKSLEQGVLARSRYADRQPSSQIDWTDGNISLLAEAQAWDSGERVRRAAVSAFGMSGTNAHLILEEAPSERGEVARPPAGVTRPGDPVPLVVCGATDQTVSAQAARLAAYLAAHPKADLGELAGALLRSRAQLSHRGVVVAGDAASAGSGLLALARADDTVGHTCRGSVLLDPRVAFVFPGQGSEWTGMGVELLDSSPVFAERLLACDAALSSCVSWSVRDVLRGVEGAPSIERIEVVQPVLWAVMMGLAALWQSYGVEPAAVVGHSQGEIAAACVAGALTLADAARVVAVRSQAMSLLEGIGGMAAVSLPVGDTEHALQRWSGRLSVAAVNGPLSCVVSGDMDAITEFVEVCEADGARVRRLGATIAGHSAHIDQIRAAVVDALVDIEPRPSLVPIVSTVTGTRIDSTIMDADYWADNMRATVRFAAATEDLLASGHRAFIQVSPHPTL
ncbi:MAG TPA: type I polyketide synthase, partial [Jatrophihabitantaceae bacterium]|nr:type I polyketide synthase [Jatrophihabitantaceae bacterium]